MKNSKKENLTRSVAITESAYEELVRISELTGVTIGQLATNAITRAFDPKRNPELAEAVSNAKQQIVRAMQ